MAVAFRSYADIAGGGGNATCDKPAGTVDDDIMIAVLRAYGADGIAPPAGWTEFANDPFDEPSNVNLHCFWKRAASEGSNYTFTLTTPDYRELFIASFSGCLTSGSPLDVVGTMQGNFGTSVTGLSITTTVADTLVVQVNGFNGDSTSVSSPHSGMTERVDARGAGLIDETQAAAGATGNRTATASGNDLWRSFLFALAPATGGGGGGDQPTSKRHGGVPFMALPGRGNVWAPVMRHNMLVGPSSPVMRKAA